MQREQRVQVLAQPVQGLPRAPEQLVGQTSAQQEQVHACEIRRIIVMHV